MRYVGVERTAVVVRCENSGCGWVFGNVILRNCEGISYFEYARRGYKNEVFGRKVFTLATQKL